jgi:LacI family transcriptional regulator
MSPRRVRIALVIGFGLDYCRGVLRGVKRYAQHRPDWQLAPIVPESAAPSLRDHPLPDGIIAHVADRKTAAVLRSFACPVVNVCGLITDLPFARVGVDDALVGEAAARHLLERGLRRFICVGHQAQAAVRLRAHGFARALARADAVCERWGAEAITARDPSILLDPRLLAMLRRVRPPVGIFAANDVIAMQLSEMCARCGLAVPDDVSILGVDNDDLLCELARPSLSSVELPTEAIGYHSCATIHALLARGRRRATLPSPLLLPPLGVVARRSTDLLALDDALVAAAVGWIRENAHRRVGVAQVAAAVRSGRRTLERRFRRCVGRTLAEELGHARIALVQRLLTRTDLAMSQVAEKSGFGDPKRLARTFRRATGISPTGYRAQLRPR